MLADIGRILRREPAYVRRPPLVLVNGLAEQAETWFRNLPAWRKHFDCHAPNILAYDGDALQARIASGEPVSIDYLVEQLHQYLRQFVQSPPYHLGGSSTGGKVVVEFAARYPELVSRVVMFGPSGVSDEERLPVVQGVRRHDVRALVESVFHDPRRADPRLLGYYKVKLADRRWRAGLLRTVRGTVGHSIRGTLARLDRPALMIVGANDQIVDPVQAESAGKAMPKGRVVVLPRCGHAPHVEFARRVNRMVVQFLTGVVV